MIMSTNAGPNGPATATCLQDLTAISRDKELWTAVKGLLKEFKGPDPDNHRPEGDTKSIHSKLVALSDKAGKTRVIAIGDW